MTKSTANMRIILVNSEQNPQRGKFFIGVDTIKLIQNSHQLILSILLANYLLLLAGAIASPEAIFLVVALALPTT